MARYSQPKSSDDSTDVEASSSDSDTKRATKKIKTHSLKLKRKYSQPKSSDDSTDVEASNKRGRLEVQPKKKTEAEKLLDNYFSANGFQQIERKNYNSLDLSNKNEEMYLVQISKNFEPELLIGKKISFDTPTKFKIENETFKWDVNRSNPKDIILLNFDNLVHLRLKGLITLQSRVKQDHSHIDMEVIDDIIEIPRGLKLRHPLFGTKYEERIKLDADILKKLDEIASDIDKKSKKKSKKKHRGTFTEAGSSKEEIVEEKDDALDIIKLLNGHESQMDRSKLQDKKRKKKSKHRQDEHEAIINEIENEAESIFSQLFSDIDSPKRKITDQSDRDAGDPFTIVNAASNSKKEKKHKHSLDLSPDIIPLTTLIYDGDKPKNKKKKKKYLDEMENENLMSHMSTNEEVYGTNDSKSINEDVPIDVSTIKRKKHKKAKNTDGNSFEAENEDTANILLDLDKRKKEKKHKHKDIFECDTMNVDLNETKKKKKKKHDTVVANSTMAACSLGTTLQLDESCIPKAKKKRKHRNSMDNVIGDIVKDATSYEEAVQPKMKKSKKDKTDSIY